MNQEQTHKNANFLKRAGAAATAVATLALGACGTEKAPAVDARPVVIEQPSPSATTLPAGEAPASTEKPATSELVGSSKGCRLERTNDGALEAVITFSMEERPEPEASNRTVALVTLSNTAGVKEVMRSSSEFTGLEESDFTDPSHAVSASEISLEDYQTLGGKLKDGVNAHVYLVDNLPQKDFGMKDRYSMGDGLPRDIAEQFACNLNYVQVGQDKTFTPIG